MKNKIIFIITVMLATIAGQLKAQDKETNMPYVIYDEGSTTLYFTCHTGDELDAGGQLLSDGKR